MTGLLWRVTGPPNASRYAELQTLSWWVRGAWLAALAAAAYLSPWPLLGAAVVVAACWAVHGWKRRWIRVDDHHVRIGRAAFARADIQHTQECGTEVLREQRGEMGWFMEALFRRVAPAAIRVVGGIPRLVAVGTRTPEGVEGSALIATRRPAELIAAMTVDPPPDDSRGLRAFSPAPAPTRDDDLQVRYRGRVPATAAHWQRVAVAGLATAGVVTLATRDSTVAAAAASAVVAAAALVTIVAGRRRVTVEAGLLCFGEHRLPLEALRSLRPVTVPELGWLGATTRMLRDAFVYAEAAAAVPPWATEGVVLTFSTPDTPVPAEVPRGRLPPDEETTAVAVVAAADSERLIAALLEARAELVGP